MVRITRHPFCKLSVLSPFAPFLSSSFFFSFYPLSLRTLVPSSPFPSSASSLNRCRVSYLSLLSYCVRFTWTILRPLLPFPFISVYNFASVLPSPRCSSFRIRLSLSACSSHFRIFPSIVAFATKSVFVYSSLYRALSSSLARISGASPLPRV